MNIVPRDQVWPGKTPTNMDGTPRPKMASNRPWYTIHYTGGGLWLDPDDTPDELRSIQNFAASASKGTPWEYNYVIDGQGMIWEYAGDYRAAHSSGENDKAYGVLLLVGFAGTYPNVTYWEQPTSQMIDAVRWLRAWLLDRQMLAVDHLMSPHRNMPDAATVCPGDAVMSVWSQLTQPCTPTPPDPEPPLPKDDDRMYLAFLTDGTVVVVGSAVRPVSGDEIAPGGPYADLPRYVPNPTSYWHGWLAAGSAEYSARVMG